MSNILFGTGVKTSDLSPIFEIDDTCTFWYDIDTQTSFLTDHNIYGTPLSAFAEDHGLKPFMEPDSGFSVFLQPGRH
jgi:hypothetical protein